MGSSCCKPSYESAEAEVYPPEKHSPDRLSSCKKLSYESTATSGSKLEETPEKIGSFEDRNIASIKVLDIEAKVFDDASEDKLSVSEAKVVR